MSSKHIYWRAQARRFRFSYMSCGRKVRYSLEEHAYEAARKLKMRHYYCDLCRGYHLTSK